MILSFHKSSVSFDFPVLVCLKDCIQDVAELIGGKLKMNDDKTELMAHWHQVQIKSGPSPKIALMSISGCDIPFSQSVRNLGFYLDETLSMDAHIKCLCSILFCQLGKIGKNPLLPVS